MLHGLTGTPSDISRLAKLLPKTSSLKVSLGGWTWKPEDPLPKAEVLKKAKLWTSDDLAWLRDILISPALKVDVSETEDSLKVETSFGSTIHVLKPAPGMPKTVLQIPISLCLIDTRGMSVEDTEVLLGVPGRSKFASVPVMLFGGVPETQVQKAAVMKACGGEWVGEERSVDVFTSETSLAYTAARRRLLLLLPEGCAGKKVPPMMNITHVQPITLGWAAVVGIFRTFWREPKPKSDEPKIDWLYVLSDDIELPVILSQKIDSHPSVIFCSLSTALRTDEVAAKIKEQLKDQQESPPLQWGRMMTRAQKLESIFEVSSSDDDESEEREEGRSPPHKTEKQKQKQRRRRQRSEDVEEEGPFFWESEVEPPVKPKPKKTKEAKAADPEHGQAMKKAVEAKKAKKGSDLAKRLSKP